jgi:hypothetical protein
MSTGGSVRSGRRSLVVAAVLACVVLSACAQTKKAPVAVSDTSAATLQPIPGTGLERIILSPRAAYRIGIQTAPVARAGGSLERIPYAAVMYSPDGSTYVYSSPSHLTFVRAPIAIVRIGGGVAYLRDGPPPGTRVVTVGSDELLGTEEGVQDEEATLRRPPGETRQKALRPGG